MAWQNAFALGACAVEVWRSGQLIPAGEYGSEGISVQVSDAGLVTMSAPEIGGSGYNYEVRVVPSYPTNGRAVRLAVALTPDEGAQYDEPIWSVGATGVDPFEGFERPFEYTPKGPWTWAGYRAGKQGV
ncbi:hypothetical protein J5226_12885 [Lysobacter sp. K5869]|uniref:hypothetical protein n=1 Tax=Lysobacter sp. K5869 TaxID=2820808 RepID=UPI001C05F003|nr:hypothetical protein [Lysobacter sp. K5869]QWP79220.1 hypothetical protein J5226_12885 [Lysobacter sp. K5869]